ncbi:hypothetical protein ASF53_20395 [Methylobacterium sp. Leaf123]|uniref:hypothetical protein n=1 Tax=Methylobacterium sp. Leaf123 TaxID=1736264 RepID=UPI0006FCA852|nr:hypothetical protein [Methylobacterium sp. Leaf123]KQQ27033.1 hypothetical protein ASF53_20395 [Methylobacterium sp. Leaf123]
MRRVLLASLTTLALLAALPVRAESREGARHAAWQACLDAAFAEQIRTTSRSFAATKAVSTCQDREEAYLGVLAGSPLLDGEDVTRIRPALVARARDRLMGERRYSAL